MNLYAESSAILAWLLNQQGHRAVRGLLDQADYIIASELTLVECERALSRLADQANLAEAAVADLRGQLRSSAACWILLTLDEAVLQRAGRAFPVEPLRTLDALHLASALEARAALPETVLLSLDRRVRDNGGALGFQVLPA